MADFSTPFATNAEKRTPTTVEKQSGFPCGAADQTLFNGLFHRIEAELGEVINFGGVAPTDTRNTLVREAIQTMINTAIGALPDPEDPEAPDLSGFIAMSQARARLPFYPHVNNVDGKINVVSPGTGVARLPGGVEFLHRGIFPVTTVQTDFNTVASRIYHLRWDLTNSFRLLWLNDVAYNPAAAPETDPRFDSDYDDMLIARVVSNSSNALTITPVSNKCQLMDFKLVTLTFPTTPANGTTRPYSAVFDWARTPKVPIVSWTAKSHNQTTAAGLADVDEAFTKTVTRYTISGNVKLDYADSAGTNIQVSAIA